MFCRNRRIEEKIPQYVRSSFSLSFFLLQKAIANIDMIIRTFKTQQNESRYACKKCRYNCNYKIPSFNNSVYSTVPNAYLPASLPSGRLGGGEKKSPFLPTEYPSSICIHPSPTERTCIHPSSIVHPIHPISTSTLYVKRTVTSAKS